MSPSMLEEIDRDFKNYPYWVLANVLAKNLGDEGLIDYPTFPRQDRYRELSWRGIYDEDDEDEPIPLTPAEKEEYRELRGLNDIYSVQLSELRNKTMLALKTMMVTFGLVPPENINAKTFTTDPKTLDAWEGVVRCPHEEASA